MRSTPSLIRRLTAASALAAAMLVPAVAQSQDRPIRIGFGGGVTVPTDDYRDALKNGINGQGFVLFRLPGLPLSLRGTLNYNRFEFKTEGFPGGEGIDGNTQILAGLANVTFDLISVGPIRPYVLAGLGAFNVKSTLDGVDGSSASETNFGIDGGAGLKLRLGRLDAYVEGRVANVYTDEGGMIDTKSIRYIPVTFGIMF